MGDRIELWVDRVCDKIKEADPVAVIEVTRDTYEDEDIDINVFTSAGRIREIEKATNPVASEALINEGYNILVLPMVHPDGKPDRPPLRAVGCDTLSSKY